ncbi:general substrate transporter [Dipodascopsis uninucleata]
MVLLEEDINRIRTENEQIVGERLAAVLPVTEKPWYYYSHLRQLNGLLFLSLFFSSANGYDGSMMNGLQSLEQWQYFMKHPTGKYLGFINAINAAGSLMGLGFAGSIADRYGRKLPLLISITIVTLGAFVGALAYSPEVFIASRFIVGFGASFAVGAPLLISELSYPTHRGRLTSMYNSFYFTGSLVAAWLTFFTRDLNALSWRIPTVFQAGLPLLALFCAYLIPESPRWLISKGQLSQARQILVKYHAGGEEDSKLVEFEMDEISRIIALDQTIAKTTSWSNLWSTKGNRHRLLITVTLGIFAQWSGNGIVSYYLAIVLASAGIESQTEQTLINGALQIWNLIFAVGASILVDRIGRRTLFLWSASGMMVSYAAITALAGVFANTSNRAVGLGMIPVLFVYYSHYDIAFSPLVVSYPAEIWTFVNRSKGLVTVNASTHLALLLNLFINPIALDKMGWKYYMVYVGILAVVLFTCYTFYPETRGHTLEEMAIIFDGEDKALQEEMYMDLVENEVSLPLLGDTEDYE